MHALATRKTHCPIRSRAAGVRLLDPARRLNAGCKATAVLAAAFAVQAPALAQDPATIHLTGTIRDFTQSHPDFNITDPSVMGHYVHNVAWSLGSDGRPIFTGGGTEVVAQWQDEFGNPIMPYIGDDPGLPGGHFDVDVFEVGGAKAWHKHEFDDAYDVNYVDIFADTKLLYDELVGDYPNDLRVEFMHPDNSGAGTYEFQAGGPLLSGSTANGFAAVFTPSELTKFRVDFYSLPLLRQTVPSLVQNDVANRNDAFSVRMYDVITDELVYEVSVYSHVSNGESSPPPPPPPDEDSCGVSLHDTQGAFGTAGTAAVTGSDSFETWFKDVLGMNLSSHHTIALERDAGGVYEFCEVDYYPIDDRLFGNEGETHNNFFTYVISATFTYDACSGQFFEFEGNDDAWVYIDGDLVLDLGGVATLQRQYVPLDRLDLTDGQEYTLDFFYAQRWPSLTSLFCMRTNIVLHTENPGTISESFD
jgi:fibro-slime domain-containing protein